MTNRIVKKIIKIFNRKEFSFFIFGIFLVLWSWPFLSIFDKGIPKLIYYYLFFMWALSIIILFLMSLGKSQGSEELDKKDLEN